MSDFVERGGCIGHHVLSPKELARVRRTDCAQAAARGGHNQERPFPIKRPPRAVSFKRRLGGGPANATRVCVTTRKRYGSVSFGNTVNEALPSPHRPA